MPPTERAPTGGFPSVARPARYAPKPSWKLSLGRLTEATLVTEGSQGSGRYGAERPFCTAVDLSALIS